MDSNLIDIVRDIISGIDLSIPVQSIVGDRIYLCNTMHITIGKIVKDEAGAEYKVTDFLFNKWIEVVPYNHLVAFDSKVVIAPSITFLHGTPSSTNNEYLIVNQRTMEKTPFIWLLVSYEVDNLSRESSIVATYNARLFFMDWADTPKWTNDNHNDLVIKPMENLSKAFVKVIEDNYVFKSLNGYTMKPRPRFGVEVTNKGSGKQIIQEDLSGVDLSLTLEMYDTKICC
tara:strand:+ start:2759 stop:3445 length:687 start_codon:yes stop_codon:yes gene_type:complete